MEVMKFPVILLLVALAGSVASAAPKVRWPRDVVEWEKLKEAEKVAQEEGKGFAFIFIPSIWDAKDAGVARSIDATNDAIRALKSFCLMVKGDYQEVVDASRGKDNGVPKALITGLSGAGNTYPLVVVLDGEMKTVLGKTSGGSWPDVRFLHVLNFASVRRSSHADRLPQISNNEHKLIKH